MNIGKFCVQLIKKNSYKMQKIYEITVSKFLLIMLKLY